MQKENDLAVAKVMAVKTTAFNPADYLKSEEDVIAYLGPAIGPQAFEVGDEVRSAFIEVDEHAAQAFKTSVAGKWLADIYWLARQRLQRKGVTSVYGGMQCTYDEADRFFSYRRDGQTGRMASLIWLDRPE